MTKYVLKRVAVAIPVLLIVAILSFVLVYFAPGDPALQYRSVGMSEETYQAMRQSMGYADPVLVQFGRWFVNMLHGDFGTSSSMNAAVGPIIMNRLPATLLITLSSIVLSVVVAIPLGLIGGRYQGTKIDKALNAVHYVAISLPTFWFCILLIIVFSLQLGWLPSSGMSNSNDGSALDVLRHAILPIIALSVDKISIYARYVREATIRELKEDYVLFALSKGASMSYILKNHVLKNCLLPVITLVGMNMGSIISGAFIVETIFGWPGLGTTAMNALYNRDYNLIMGTTMLSCLLLILGNLLADICYAYADPRIKVAKEGK